MKDIQLIRWLLSFVSNFRNKVILAVSLGILSNLAVIVIPLTGVHALLKLVQGDFSTLKFSFILMLVCGAVRGVARYCEQYLNHEIAFRLLAVIREEIFQALRKLGPARLSGKRSGDLVAAITTDVEALEVFFAHTISPVLIALGTTLVTISYLAFQNLTLALLLLAGQLLVGIAIPVIGYRQNRALGDDYQKAFVDLNQKVMEDVASLQDIAQYSLEKKKLQELAKAGKDLNQRYAKRLRQESSLKIWSEAVLLITAVCILFAGYQLQLIPEVVLTGTVLSLSSFGPVLALSGLGSSLLTVLASARRLSVLTTEEAKVTFEDSKETLEDFAENNIDNISFAYEPEQEGILQDLSLRIEKGDFVGIGGESGNGKSTLLKLLMRYWDPQTGEITFDQTNLKDIQETSIHQLEGVMEQTTFIFEDTIAQNIALGKKDATQEEIETAAQKASLHDWIMTLPEKYETRIGKLSRDVSDGERQRIGLARMFLHDAPFLLLDEPTSNLDYLNEQAILYSLRNVTEGKTVILVSHRGTTLAIADQCYELSKGNLKKIEGIE